MELYNAVDTVCRSNPSLETIIAAAAGAYFAGDKTLEETAELIKSYIRIKGFTWPADASGQP